jgi:hypothetical protein
VVNEFLVANQTVMVPVIQWGLLFVLLAIVLSPFMLIRLRMFRPTRWWHIVGAYVGSFLNFFLLQLFLNHIDQWLTRNLFTTWEMSGAYTNAHILHWVLLVPIYPLLLFYSTKMLYGSFTWKRFLIALAVALIFAVLLGCIFFYTMLALLGQGLMQL